GLERGLIDAVHAEMKGFFAEPVAAKRAISRTAENPGGFYDKELTKNTRGREELYDFVPPHGGAMRPPWPTRRPRVRPVLEAYYDACEALAFRLLAALSTNLGMPSGHLDRDFQPEHTSFVRLNYYPRCPAPARVDGLVTPVDGHLGINHHTDAGALTLLL